MPHCLVVCKVLRNLVIRTNPQARLEIPLSSLFLSSLIFLIFLFFFVIIAHLYWKNADEEIVAASRYPLASLLLASGRENH